MKLISFFRLSFSRFVIILLLISFIGIAGCSNELRTKVRVVSQFNKTQKPTVAVLDFEHEKSKKKKKPFVAGLFSNPGAGYIIPNILSKELSKSGMFNVVDRQVIMEKLKEPKYSNMEGFEDYKAFAETFGADAIIVGTFKRFGFLYPTIIPRMMVMFNAEYVDIKSTQTIWYIKVKAQSSKDLDERDLARKQIIEAIEGLRVKLGKTDGELDNPDGEIEGLKKKSGKTDVGLADHNEKLDSPADEENKSSELNKIRRKGN